jgi:hypothetical protein
MCCICAGTPNDAAGGKVDIDLKIVMIPICDNCKSKGVMIVFGCYDARNIQAILKC